MAAAWLIDKPKTSAVTPEKIETLEQLQAVARAHGKSPVKWSPNV